MHVEEGSLAGVSEEFWSVGHEGKIDVVKQRNRKSTPGRTKQQAQR